MVEIELTDPPKSGGAMVAPAPTALPLRCPRGRLGGSSLVLDLGHT